MTARERSHNRSVLRSLALLASLAALLLCSSCALPYRDAGSRFGDDASPIAEARFAPGDEPRFAVPDFDDSGWPLLPLHAIPTRERACWIRVRTTIDRDALDGGAPSTLAVYLSAVAASEVYWDGELLFRNGSIGSDGRMSSPGRIDLLVPLEGARRSHGVHVLAIRLAPLPEHERPDRWLYGLAVGDLARMSRQRVLDQLLPMASLGVFLVVGVYFLALHALAGRSPSHLAFAGLCFATALLLLAECSRWIAGYPADLHLVRLRVVLGLSFAVAVLLPLFFLLEFSVPHRRRILGGRVVVLGGISWSDAFYDRRCLTLLVLSTLVSVCAVSVGLWHRRTGAAPAALGILVVLGALLWDGYAFLDRSFFLSATFLVVCLLFTLSRSAARQREEREEARLRAARLEVELLKRGLAPHFLMNTLTAAMEWIEEDPPAGVAFLSALAEELRLLSEISSEKLIPLSVELRLCRAHLSVMTFRKGTRFDLRTRDTDDETLVPPAVLHTLLENAITHNRYGDGERVTFELRQEDKGEVRRLTLDVPLRARAERTEEGLGLRYVKARLEESFPGRWRLESNAVDGGASWRTRLVMGAA